MLSVDSHEICVIGRWTREELVQFLRVNWYGISAPAARWQRLRTVPISTWRDVGRPMYYAECHQLLARLQT